MLEDRQAILIDGIHPDLLVPPHIVERLFQFVVGEWVPDTSQQEQLVEHFMECRYCRTALIVLLSAMQQDERSHGFPEASVGDLLTRFVALHHEIEAHDYESMGVYAEAIVAKGHDEADKCFPILAEHIKRCLQCKSTLEELLAFLKDPELAG